MSDAIRAREAMLPTAMDNGVAFLHPRRPLPQILAQPLLALGITPQGVPFGHSRGQLTDIFFLIASTDDAGHLRTLARLSRIVALPDLLDKLRAAAGPRDAWETIVAADAEIEQR
jgi:PTS system nitrogen regulatory IIA component